MPTTPPYPTIANDTQALYDTLGSLTAQDAALGYPLLKWLDGPGRLLETIDDLVRDSPLGPGWSQVVDPIRCPTAILPWLGQFVGVSVDASLSDTAQRNQIRAEAGFARGTVASLMSIARRYLAGNGTVHLVERDQGDPYRLSMTVFQQQIVGMSYSALSANYSTYAALGAAFPTYAQFSYSADELNLALQAAKPAGLVLTLNVQTGASYADLTSEYPTYQALSSAFPTYAPMTNTLPFI